ncbi:MAG: hypothetical protein IGS49_01820 [Chlorogloeopsis fritschii C42_A2020_084]|uniref:hypothetical protein n=1 Tax=Chlorogloeopsis fritschii TaxID=1124 RepID=UPI001A029AA2|nr:hypothetical protein [Chlorogloeopsis fritschii]MBF2004232.1 hypothetical protein [Chlorogloeopsis fritschii C42_A2020_084]
MLAEIADEQQRQWLVFWLFIWVIVIIIVCRSQWNKKLPSVGLPLMYLFNLSIIHWFGALIYTFPWYNPNKNAYLASQGSSLTSTAIGFQESVYGAIAFGLGNLILAPYLLKMLNPPWLYEFPQQPNFKLTKTYLILGLLFSLVLSPILSRIPSGTALMVSGTSLFIVGLCLACWESWQSRNKKAFLTWILISCGLPLYSLLTSGFMSFGTAAAVVVLLFVFNFYRPRWKLVVIGLLTIYFGLSVFVTYLRDRSAIRAAEASSNSRIEEIQNTVSQFELFDPLKQEHLESIDTRINQNVYVGMGVSNISSGLGEYAEGKTIEQGLISAVPRVLWPDKPTSAGSGDLITQATGLKISEGTSMGIGQVLEFYFNFGSWGVFVGFLVFGTVLRVIDITAGYKLMSGNLLGFASWFLPGLGLLQPIGSLVDIVQTTAGSIVFVYILNWLYLKKEKRRQALANWNKITNAKID